MAHLKINNKIDNPRWKSIPCSCKHDDEHIELDYPIHACIHCKFTECESSMPTESFIVNEPIFDKDNKPTGETSQREILSITLVNGPKYGDLIGWQF